MNDQDTTTVKQPQLTYGDFALWQSARLNSKMPSHARSINGVCSRPCLDAISNSAPVNQLPGGGSDRSRVTLSLAPNMFSRMKRITASVGALPAHFILAALQSFLLSQNCVSDTCIFVVDEGRPHVDVEGMIGCFTRITPVRFSIRWNSILTFEALLQNAKESATEAMEHTDVDIARIERHGCISPGTRESSTITQAALQYENYNQFGTFQAADFDMSVQDHMLLPLHVPIFLKAIEVGEELMLLMDCSLFSIPRPTDANGFLESFVSHLSSLIRDHRQPVMP